MIKNGTAYEKAQRKLRQAEAELAAETVRLHHLGLNARQVAKQLAPLYGMCEKLARDIRYYEEIKRGVFPPIRKLTELGRHLIAYRIYIHMSQAELAARLGVSESQISRDERNEYYGATVSKLEAVIDALGMRTTIRIEGGGQAASDVDWTAMILPGGMKDEGHSDR